MYVILYVFWLHNLCLFCYNKVFFYILKLLPTVMPSLPLVNFPSGRAMFPSSPVRGFSPASSTGRETTVEPCNIYKPCSYVSSIIRDIYLLEQDVRPRLLPINLDLVNLRQYIKKHTNNSFLRGALQLVTHS